MAQKFYKSGGVGGLGTGQTHKVLFFPKNATCTVPAATFAFNSAFPAAGARVYLEHVARVILGTPDASLVVFGHADKHGTDDANKKVSDRRARALLALMTGDALLLETVAGEDHWGPLQDQAMLRAVGYNPGPVDGSPGPLTKAAVRAFQLDWNDGDMGQNLRLHIPDARGVLAGKLAPMLDGSGQFDDDTRSAIRLAYLDSMPGCTGGWQLPRFGGCASFNPISDEDAKNRRVVVGLVTSPTGPVPCKEGDATACDLDGQKPFTCRFYRSFFRESAKAAPLADFFDFQWFHERTSDDSIVVHLSALTTLPDDTAATFKVSSWKGPAPRRAPQSWRGDERPSAELAADLGSVQGQIKGGVCFAKWTPADGGDPRRIESWFEESDLVDERDGEADDHFLADDMPLWDLKADFDAGAQLRPPVFCIEADGKWGFSGPPGRDARLMTFVGDEGSTGLAVLIDGTVVPVPPGGGSSELRVIELGLGGFARTLLPDEEQAGDASS